MLKITVRFVIAERFIFCLRSVVKSSSCKSLVLKQEPLKMALFAMFFMYILFWNSKGENEEKRLVMPDEFDVY